MPSAHRTAHSLSDGVTLGRDRRDTGVQSVCVSRQANVWPELRTSCEYYVVYTATNPTTYTLRCRVYVAESYDRLSALTVH